MFTDLSTRRLRCTLPLTVGPLIQRQWGSYCEELLSSTQSAPWHHSRSSELLSAPCRSQIQFDRTRTNSRCFSSAVASATFTHTRSESILKKETLLTLLDPRVLRPLASPSFVTAPIDGLRPTGLSLSMINGTRLLSDALRCFSSAASFTLGTSLPVLRLPRHRGLCRFCVLHGSFAQRLGLWTHSSAVCVSQINDCVLSRNQRPSAKSECEIKCGIEYQSEIPKERTVRNLRTEFAPGRLRAVLYQRVMARGAV